MRIYSVQNNNYFLETPHRALKETQWKNGRSDNPQLKQIHVKIPYAYQNEMIRFRFFSTFNFIGLIQATEKKRFQIDTVYDCCLRKKKYT